jgi:environmental stress-induced protein Ves
MDSDGGGLLLLPRDRQRLVPWRNGQGSTREIAIEPPAATVAGPFLWRVSSATVGADGPFSPFPGVDRTLWLLRGRGLLLDVGGEERRLDAPLQRVDFRGETAVRCRLLGGPIDDLNVMVDRRRAQADCELLRLPAGATIPRVVAGPATTVLFAIGDDLEVRVALDPPFGLGDGDALSATTPPRARTDLRLSSRGGAAVLVAVFRRRAGADAGD